jgi:hypothetical protein
MAGERSKVEGKIGPSSDCCQKSSGGAPRLNMLPVHSKKLAEEGREMAE